MNLDPSNFNNSDQRIRTPDDHRFFSKGLGHDRAYKCTFCKRGFSNAQALGGHMNIHRKDRARLKEFSCDNFLSLEINRSHKPSFPCGTHMREYSCVPDYKEDDSVALEEDPVRDLPLFSEEPSVSEAGEKPEAENIWKGHVDKELGFVSHVEVDLELRLGPEPDHDASMIHACKNISRN